MRHERPPYLEERRDDENGGTDGPKLPSNEFIDGCCNVGP